MENINNCEIWKDITGYKNLYQVSNFGRVRDVDGNIKKLFHQSKGYLFVDLVKDKIHTKYLIHRLVAMAFIPNPDNLPQVNHINEIKTDNRAINLEWCSVKYNCNYGEGKKRELETKNQRGVSGAEKPVKQLSLNGELIQIWRSAAEAGRNGFFNQCIARCCLGQQNKHKGFRWEYA